MTNVFKVVLGGATVLLAIQAFAQNACVDQGNAALRAASRIGGMPMEVSLIPGLKDDLIDLAKLKQHDQSEAAAIGFYNVVEGEYDIDCTKVTGQSFRLDGYDRQLVVAVNSKGDTYVLDGSDSDGDNFNRLVKDNLALHIANADEALKLFYLYMATVHHHDREFPVNVREFLVNDDVQLEIAALADLRSQYGAKDGKKKFDSWWSKLDQSAKRAITEPTAKATKEGFEITYYMYFPVKVGRVKVIVHQDGTVSPVQP